MFGDIRDSTPCRHQGIFAAAISRAGGARAAERDGDGCAAPWLVPSGQLNLTSEHALQQCRRIMPACLHVECPTPHGVLAVLLCCNAV